MRVGTVHLEEARALDAMAGIHTRGLFKFEVAWFGESECGIMRPGWRWCVLDRGNMPCGPEHGPFASSRGAYYAALESVGVEI